MTLDEARAPLQALWPPIRDAVVPANLTGAERDEFLALQLKVQSAARGFSETRGWYAGPLRLLASATTWLMLIVAANLVGLMLSLAMLRQNELTTRAALGASRGRLVRQWLTEGCLLAVAGGTLGLPIAWKSAEVLATMLFSIWAPDPSFHLDLSPDWRIAAPPETPQPVGRYPRACHHQRCRFCNPWTTTIASSSPPAQVGDVSLDR